MNYRSQFVSSRQRQPAWQTTLTLCIGLCAFLATANTLCARDYESEFQADELPGGYDVEFKRYTVEDIPWVAATIRNSSEPDSRVALSISKRAMPTHASRVSAARAYMNGIASSLGKIGFKPFETRIPNPNKLDWRKQNDFRFKYKNEADEQITCLMRIWFSSDAGYSATVLGTDVDELKKMYEWTASIKTIPEVDSSALRTWKSAKGHSVEASLRWEMQGLVRIRRKNGVDVDLKMEQLSAADQEFVNKSNLRALQLNSEKHNLTITMPVGFAPASPRTKDMLTFKHLDGTAIDVGIATWPEKEVSDVQALLTKMMPPNTAIAPLPNAKQEIMACEFAGSPDQARTNRCYATRLNTAAVVLMAEASSENMEPYRKILDACARTLRSTK